MSEERIKAMTEQLRHTEASLQAARALLVEALASRSTVSEAIRLLLRLGCTIEAPYKCAIKRWFEQLKITLIDGEKPRVFLQGTPFVGHEEESLDEAISKFLEVAFGKGNLGLAYQGIRRHGLCEEDFDRLTVREIKDLIRLYWKEYYEKDYGHVR